MALRGITVAALAVGLAGLSVGCGSTSKSDNTGTQAETCDPNGAIPCYAGKTEPCDNFNPGFPGDDLCMKPPDNGFQLHVGPKDYTDPEEIAKWTLPAGGFPGQGPDVNFCYYMKSPNPTDIYTSEYYSHMRPGSHHYIMFGLAGGTDLPDSTGPDSCASRDAEVAGGANFLSGATREVQDAAMFGDAPEDQGLGSPMPAHEQLNMNLHFVNIGNDPVLMEMWVNLIERPASEVTDIVKAVEWYGGLTMAIAPGVHTVLQSPTTGCNPPLQSSRLLGVTAHMHANTTRVSMYWQQAGAASRSLVFDDFDWSEPTVFRYNSVIKNPLPDPTTSKAGSPISGIFMTNPADQFSWECEVDNKTDVTLNFSDKAYTGEMCNVFGMYSSPVATNPWQCYF